MSYNLRTCHWLDRLRADFHMPHAHHRLLRTVLRASWRETTHKDNTGRCPLESIRHFKSVAWWTALKDLPLRRRLAAGAVHSKQGPSLCYESVFVHFVGEGWRSIRDSRTDFAGWKRYCDELMDQICIQWELPLLSRPAGASYRKEPEHMDAAGYAQLVASPFPEPSHTNDDQWGDGNHKLLFGFGLTSRGADLDGGQRFRSTVYSDRGQNG